MIPSPIHHHVVWYILAVLVLAGGAVLLAAREWQLSPPANPRPTVPAPTSDTLGSLPVDEASAVIGPKGGEVVGKSGLGMAIPPNILGNEVPIKLTLLPFDQAAGETPVDTDLQLLAVLSVDLFGGMGGGSDWLNFIVPPVHAMSYATYHFPLDIRLPVALGYSGPVLLAEIANYGGVMSAVAVDGAIAQNGFAHFEPPTYQGTTFQMFTNIFAVYAVPGSALFKENLKWSDGPPIIGAVASGPYRSVISVSNQEGIVALPVPSAGEASIYIYSPLAQGLQLAFHRAKGAEVWENIPNPPLIDNFTRMNEKTVPTILRYLHGTTLNRDWSYRTDAINALVGRKYPEIVTELCRVIREDPEETVRQSAVRALGATPIQPQTKICLQDALNDADKYVRGSAETILKKIGTEEFNLPTCETLVGTQRDICYSDEAANLKNPAVCEKIRQHPIRYQCYFKLAQQLGDYQLCSYIFDPEYGQYEALQDQCYFAIGTSKKDITVCSYISDYSYYDVSGLANKCYLVVSETEGNEICSKIKELETIDSCFLTLAIGKKLPLICERLKDEKDLCYEVMAKELNDIQLCRSIKNQDTQSYCKKNFGINQ